MSYMTLKYTYSQDTQVYLMFNVRCILCIWEPMDWLKFKHNYDGCTMKFAYYCGRDTGELEGLEAPHFCNHVHCHITVLSLYNNINWESMRNLRKHYFLASMLHVGYQCGRGIFTITLTVQCSRTQFFVSVPQFEHAVSAHALEY